MNSEASDSPKSIRNFDYFDDNAHANQGNVGEETESERKHTMDVVRTQLIIAVITAAAVVAAAAYFFSSNSDLLSYAFRSETIPQQLGDVTDFTPADIPHNAFVVLSGVTEHRGLKQKSIRGLVPTRDEYWYYRLLGSRGVFIEAPSGEDRWGFATEVTVQGRAVNPRGTIAYDGLLQRYGTQFRRPLEGELRIIQVDVVPGSDRMAFIIAFIILAMILGIDSWAIAVRIQRLRQLRSAKPSSA